MSGFLSACGSGRRTRAGGWSRPSSTTSGSCSTRADPGAWAAAHRRRGPARRSGRRGGCRPDDLAGRAAEAESGTDFRRRGERGAARADRGGGAAAAASAAMRESAALIRAEAERIKALGESSPRAARDPVNLPIIENWVEAIGDTNPVYTDAGYAAPSVHGGLLAPPAMAQVWTMAGQRRIADASDPTSQMVAVLEDAGYTSVFPTNPAHLFPPHLPLR